MAIVLSGTTGIDAGSLPVSNCGSTEIEGNLNLSGRIVSNTAGSTIVAYTFAGQESKTGILCPADEKLNIKAIQGTYFTSGAFGYGTGAGGSVTQLTSKTTPVTLDKPSGTIIMNASALAAGAYARFTLNNSIISVIDTVLLTIAGGFSGGGNYNCWVDGYATGQCGIVVKNISAGSLSEPLVLNFTLIKGANS